MNYLNASNARQYHSFLKSQRSILLGLSLLASNLAFASVAQAAIIGVDLYASTPTNWNSYTLGDVGTTKTNLIDEGNNGTDVDFLLTFPTDVQVNSYGGLTPSSTTIPNRDDDGGPNLTNVCCDVLYGDVPNSTATATWSDLIGGETYNYWFFTSASYTQYITVTGNTVDSFFTQEMTTYDVQYINHVPGSDDNFSSFARTIQAKDDGTITIDIQSLEGSTPVASGFALELAPVPVPAAAWLFGSGLIGLVGIARRKKVA